MPLSITLKRGDRMSINGCVIRNNGPRTKILIENRAEILRGDALPPSPTKETDP